MYLNVQLLVSTGYLTSGSQTKTKSCVIALLIISALAPVYILNPY